MRNRRSKRVTGFVCGILAIVPAAPTGQDAGSRFRIGVTTDRADAIYSVDDSVTFHVRTIRYRGSVAYRLSLDGAAELHRGTVDIVSRGRAAGQASVVGTLDKPGILRCTVTFEMKHRNQHLVGVGMATAAFEPPNIQPTAVKPDDFEAFWHEQTARLAEIPVEPRLVLIDQRNEKIEAYNITLNNVDGTRVHGYLAKPKGSGPFPAILRLPGAGVESASPGAEMKHAADGFLAMFITAHDVENDLPADYYAELAAGELHNYQLRGREDRDTYYFRRVFLACIRAVDYLVSRSDWDKKHLIVYGSSQGGALSLVTAALDPRVTAVAAYAPAMCDHSGLAFDRPSGWPRLVPKDENGKPDGKILEVSAYYDAANFARQITVPALFGVGLVDTTCPPTTVLAAYNVLRGPKQIEISPGVGHKISAAYDALENRWILQQAGLAK